MSSYVQQVMDEPDETPNATPVETPVEQPTETPKETPQEQPQETPPEPQGQPQEAPNPEQPTETPPEPEKAHKDLSGLSKEEKAQYAFRRQLAKQASKYESIIDEMKNTFGKQIEELKAGMNKKPEEPVKTRADFPADEGGDDAYIDYLTQRGVKKELDARDAEAKKLQEQQAEQQRELQEAQRAQQELAATFDANTKAAFRDENAYNDFQSKLRRGVQNGLAEILDEAPAVRDYVFSMPEGPVVLNEMLSNKESFIRVMSRAAYPDIARIEMYELAREIRNRAQVPPQEAPQARNPMPPIGKPGAKQGGSSGSMWDSDEALINFARSHR